MFYNAELTKYIPRKKMYILYSLTMKHHLCKSELVWQAGDGEHKVNEKTSGRWVEYSLPSSLRWHYKIQCEAATCLDAWAPHPLSPANTDGQSVPVHRLWPSFLSPSPLSSSPRHPIHLGPWQLVQSGYWSRESAGWELEAERRLIVKVMPRKMIDARLGFPVSLSGGRNV